MPRPLGDVPLHLRAEHEFGLQLGHLGFDFEIVVGDERFDVVELGGLADLARKLTRVGPEAHDVEPKLLRGDPRGCDRVRRVAKDEHALAGQIGRVDGPRVPGQPGALPREHGGRIDARDRRDFSDEVARGADTDRYRLHHRLGECALQPLRRLHGDFRIQHDVEVRLAKPGEIGRRGAERRDDCHIDPEIARAAGGFPGRRRDGESRATWRRAGCSMGAARRRAGRAACRTAAHAGPPGCERADRRSPTRPSFPCADRRAVPAPPPGWAGRARAPGRPDRPGSVRPYRRRRPASTCGWNRSKALRAAVLNSSAVSPPRSRAWKVV